MNLARMLDEGIRKFGTYDQLLYLGEDGEVVLSNVEIQRRAYALASGIRRLGVKKGDVVAVCVSNIPEVPEIINGIMREGAVFLPVVYMLTPREIGYILKDSGAMLVITEEKLVSKVSEAIRGLEDPVELVVIGSSQVWKGRPYAALLEGGETGDGYVDVAPDDLAMLMYTSGSTGFPKGVMLTHNNLESNCRQGAKVWLPEQVDRYLITVPMNHILGVLAFHESCFFGVSTVLLPGFDAGKVLEVIKGYKITVTFFVPTMITMMTEAFDPDVHSMKSVRRMICAGAPLSEETLMHAMNRFRVKIFHGYGLTEASPTVCRQRTDRPLKWGSVGPPIPGVKLKLIDDQGNEVHPGEEGEIICQGPGIMKGYLNKSDMTAEALRKGWLYTGDLGRLDQDGELYIVGRKKDLIIKGGENIDPGVSENLLHKHPAVLEAAVVGVPDPKYGEEVGAAVVLKKGKEVSESDLLAYVGEHLHHFVAPKKILILEEMPKTGIGKILKREIREIFRK